MQMPHAECISDASAPIYVMRRRRAKCATDAFTLQAPEMILMESIVPTTEICLTFAERRGHHAFWWPELVQNMFWQIAG